MTRDNKLSYEHAYSIRSYEPKQDMRVGITTICNHLQDIAARHAELLGFGFLDLEKSGHFWVLARLHVMMDRLPGFGETNRVLTWPSGNERLVALRDFIIHDADGAIGKATTSWVTLNKATKHPDPPDTVLDERLIPERDRAVVFPSKAIKRLKDGEHSTPITARRSDMDLNSHVNNVRYVEFCLEAVPSEWEKGKRCIGLDIQFRTESRAGDEYTASCSVTEAENGMESMLHSLTRSSDGKEIVRMKTWWQTV